MKAVIFLTFLLTCNHIIADENDRDNTILKVQKLEAASLKNYFPCYSVSSEENTPNVLFEYNPSTNVWTETGVTGKASIEAIATDPVTGVIYATDGGTFGIIDAQTALFTPIGETGSGNGDAGLIELNDVDGLAYDPVNKIMYGTHHISGGFAADTNDLLFQIDVTTGKVIPGAMLNADNSQVDYAIVPGIFVGTDDGNTYDVDDIAYNTYTDEFFAIHSQGGESILSTLNPVTGEINSIDMKLSIRDIEGLGFNYFGELFGTTGEHSSTHFSDRNNCFFYIDRLSYITYKFNSIDPTNQHTDFEAFDCFTAYNDLALLLEQESQKLVNTGSKVTFQLTIFNQGDFPNTNITITNYVPEGLILKDENWTDTEDGKAAYTFEGIIEPDENHTITISYLVEQGFGGQTLTNAAEISSSYLPDTIALLSKYVPTDPNGNPTALPDLDSQPDNQNNETNVVDNELNGGGPNSLNLQDEDDHDIAILEIQKSEVTSPKNYFPCYSVSEDNAAPNVLFEYNPSTQIWTQVGVTGTAHIEAIATDPVTGIIYATDGGTLGIIDAQTALFTPIGDVGFGYGDAGLIELNDVDGLTYDPVNKIMYGAHRIGGYESDANDLLFQIDVTTGNVIPGAMLNADNNPVDYAIVPNINYFGTKVGSTIDVDDIAYNTYTGKLFAIHSYESPVLSTLNPVTGEINSVIAEIFDGDIEGLGFNYFGELFGTTGDFNRIYSDDSKNSLVYIDYLSHNSKKLNLIDPTNQHTDFEAFDCFTAYNDLALLLEEESQKLINAGIEITFRLTIFNQGDFPNTNITITNYIPDGLILEDGNWIDTGDGIATYIFEGILEPGENHTITIRYLVEEGFEGQTLTNTAEISSSYLPETVELLSLYYPNDYFGNPTALPDLDSQPDNQNNETNVMDNELNGGGSNSQSLKDEDDHDIAMVQVQPVILTVNPEICDKRGSAKVEILFSLAAPFTHIWRYNNGNIFHQHTTFDSNYIIPELVSGKYMVTVTDAFNKTSIFEVVVPLLSELDGNPACSILCPAYLVVPDGEMTGHFQAQNEIDIQGYVKKSETAVFNICK